MTKKQRPPATSPAAGRRERPTQITVTLGEESLSELDHICLMLASAWGEPPPVPRSVALRTVIAAYLDRHATAAGRTPTANKER